MAERTHGSPSVTVIIDTYNYGRFIEEAIESVLSQDFPSDQVEVLVVDDGSTDDTAERVKKYLPRVQYLYKTNGGQASAFNFGFAKARGEIIALLDADDYWLPGKLRKVVNEFENHPEVGMVYHPFLEVDMQTNEQRRSKLYLGISGSPFEKPNEFFWFYSPGTSASFRRSSLQRILPVPEGLRTQADGYVGSMIIFVAPILAIPECLSAYRFHGSNLYHTEESEMSPERLKARLQLRRILVEGMTKWLDDNGFSSRQQPVRDFLDRWLLYQEGDEFQLSPPGRLRFFRHLLLYNRCYGPHLSPRVRLLNRINALAALFSGYKHFDAVQKSQARALEAVRRLVKPSITAP